jgi:hypothetical protein
MQHKAGQTTGLNFWEITMHKVKIDTCYLRALARYHAADVTVGVLIPCECGYSLNEYITFNGAIRFRIVRIVATAMSQHYNVVYIRCA